MLPFSREFSVMQGKAADRVSMGTACVLCGCETSRVVFEAGKAQPNRVLKCDSCGLMYLDGREGQSRRDRIVEAGGRVEVDPLYLAKQHRQVRDYSDIAREVESRLGRKLAIVEVGCNVGTFLNHLKERGHQVTGVELNRWCVEYAREHFGLTVHERELAQAGLDAQTFDVVIMLHLIEHLPDPNVEVREASRVLKKDGLLCIETPTYDTLPFKILRHRERSIRTSTHIFYFTPETLTRLLEKHGFNVVKVQYVGRTLTIERVLYNVGVMSGSQRLQRAIRALSNRVGLGKVQFRLNIRDMQRVYAVKGG